jgi:hypothetical protein
MGVLAGDVTCPTTPASSTKKVRVAIYATFSTSKQDPRSIEDQVARCEARLKELGILDAEITVLADEGISGELMSRPGVDELKDLLRRGEFDVVAVEDIGRIYRDPVFSGELMKIAIDSGTRLISRNDNIDTHENDRWMKLSFASMHHSQFIEDLVQRTRRAAEGRWRNDYAMRRE